MDNQNIITNDILKHICDYLIFLDVCRLITAVRRIYLLYKNETDFFKEIRERLYHNKRNMWDLDLVSRDEDGNPDDKTTFDQIMFRGFKYSCEHGDVQDYLYYFRYFMHTTMSSAQSIYSRILDMILDKRLEKMYEELMVMVKLNNAPKKIGILAELSATLVKHGRGRIALSAFDEFIEWCENQVQIYKRQRRTLSDVYERAQLKGLTKVPKCDLHVFKRLLLMCCKVGDQELLKSFYERIQHFKRDENDAEYRHYKSMFFDICEKKSQISLNEIISPEVEIIMAQYKARKWIESYTDLSIVYLCLLYEGDTESALLVLSNRPQSIYPSSEDITQVTYSKLFSYTLYPKIFKFALGMCEPLSTHEAITLIEHLFSYHQDFDADSSIYAISDIMQSRGEPEANEFLQEAFKISADYSSFHWMNYYGKKLIEKGIMQKMKHFLVHKPEIISYLDDDLAKYARFSGQEFSSRIVF